MRILIVALCIGFCIVSAVVVSSNWSINHVAPIRQDALDWAEVALLHLRPGETRHLTITMRNRTMRSIQVTPIQSDCGCLVVDTSPGRLAPQSSAELKLSITAPQVPGEFQRSLVFGAIGFPDALWRIRLAGRVDAQVWAEPAQINATFGSTKKVEALVAVRHKPNYQLGNLRSSHPAVQILDTWPIENGMMVKLSIENSAFPTSGRPASLQVLPQGEETPVLEVPVKRERRASFAFVPSRLDLEVNDQDDANILHRTVLVTCARDCDQVAPEFHSFAPWIEVEAEAISSNTWALKLSIDANAWTGKEFQPLIRARLADRESEDFYGRLARIR